MKTEWDKEIVVPDNAVPSKWDTIDNAELANAVIVEPEPLIETVYRKMNTLESIAHDAELLNRAMNDITNVLGNAPGEFSRSGFEDNLCLELLTKYYRLVDKS